MRVRISSRENTRPLFCTNRSNISNSFLVSCTSSPSILTFFLVNTALPKDMFELVGDDTIRYIGGVEQWKENFVTNIRKKAEAITTENMLEFVGPVYQLEKALENPLDIAYHFYLDGEGYQSFAEKSFAFMEFVCTLEPGTILYIGGVIDYHF